MERNWQAEILTCLLGIPCRDYANWSGSSRLLDLYDSSDGDDRAKLVEAIGEILKTNSEPRVIGSLVQFVTAQDLVQLDEVMRDLATSGKFVDEPEILQAVASYFVMRKLRASSEKPS